MIHIEARHLKIVQDILKAYPYSFCAFGSRVKGTQRRLSDLDLCCMEPLPLQVRAQLEEAFEESDLPFTVDIIAWPAITPEFQKLIREDLELIQ
jgi:predicted nucleotidyltransferase